MNNLFVLKFDSFLTIILLQTICFYTLSACIEKEKQAFPSPRDDLSRRESPTGKKTTIFLSKLSGEKQESYVYIQIFSLMSLICLFPLDD